MKAIRAVALVILMFLVFRTVADGPDAGAHFGADFSIPAAQSSSGPR